ncbi:hypothetical protein DPMN_182940 [Dreissena polymorpha]|uniref:Uncharacterized protein n=1 Tax=Dreissena polymorpha TaxID=45954 RepID=A0A9D4I550_DREPO|nr:hypothetical protein DPMN_182940 [Dreissena polymorpha]
MFGILTDLGSDVGSLKALDVKDGAASRSSCISILDGDGGDVTVAVTGYRRFPDRMCDPAFCVDSEIEL